MKAIAEISRDEVLNRWKAGMPVAQIAAECACSNSSVYRIADHAFIEGDLRGAPRSPECIDMFRATEHMKKIAENYRQGLEISSIAKRFGLPEHVVRAAVYLATQAGLDTGLRLGA